MAKRGKKYREVKSKYDSSKRYTVEEALEWVPRLKYAKFDESVDVATRLGVDPRRADQMVRGTVLLPHGIGKSVRVVVFAKGEKAKEAQEAGADFVGGEELVKKISDENWLDFDKAIATPDMMSVVGKIGKILGVKYIVIGRVTEFTVDTKGGVLGGVGLTVSTARVALDGRLVDTTTAEILASVRGSGESKQTGLALSLKNLPFIAFGAKNFQESILGKATKAAIADFSTKLTTAVFGGSEGAAAPLSGKVAAVAGNKVYLNIGANDGVTVGMVFTISRVVEEVKDPDTDAVIDLITEEVCEITITEVKDSSCNGAITAGSGKPQKGDLAMQKK